MACSKTAFSSSVRDFTFEIYKHLVTGNMEENVFLSPTSVMLVLAMIRIGARNNTEKQMTQVLKLAKSDKKTFLSEVKTFSKVLKQKHQFVEIEAATKLYPHVKNNIEDEYIKDVSECFEEAVKSLDFTTKTEEARMEINYWVETQTNGKIKDILPSGSIKSRTAMILVNAIYFKGNWDEQFDQAKTKKADFFIKENKKVDVEMMGNEFEHVKYTRSDELSCKVLELPYIGKDLGMIILLPEDRIGLSYLEKRLSSATLQYLMSNMNKEKVTVQLPRFKLEATYHLKGLLKDLGMIDLFDDQLADLSGMGKDLHVSEMFHKTFIEVNEEGTEAAAATGANVMVNDCYTPPTTFIADHAFLFMIWDHRLDVPLFIGRVVHPNN